MKHLFLLVFICAGLAGLAQKTKNKPNYLRRAPAEPETWFTLAGKKNGTRLKAADLAKAESINPSDKLDGVTLLGMEVIIQKKGAEAEKTWVEGTQFTEEVKTKFSTLEKGDKLIIHLKVKNRSTQVENTLPEHKYFISG